MCGGKHQSGRTHQAMGYVNEFPDNVPLVVVSSQKDKVVHHTNSIKLALGVAAKRIAAASADEEVTPVYFLQLDKSGHNDYITAGTTDPIRYQNAIHAIYRKHQLACVANYATDGQRELVVADLANGPLRPIIKLQSQFKANSGNRLQRQKIRIEALEVIRTILVEIEDKSDKERAVSICRAMPLFYKNQPAETLFGKKNALKELTVSLDTPNKEKVNPMLLFAMQHPKLIAGLVGLLIAAAIVATVFSCGAAAGVAAAFGIVMGLSGTSALAVGTATAAVAVGVTTVFPTFFSLKAAAKDRRLVNVNDAFLSSEIGRQ